MKYLRCTVTWTVILVWLVSPFSSFAADSPDADVEPTWWGGVTGRVYDAESGLPVEGAIVVVYEEGAFAAEGNTVGKTSGTGEYDCQARLGRVSKSVKAAPFIASILGAMAGVRGAGRLAGPASTRNTRMDVTRVTMRVAKDGYRTFEGVVLCREPEVTRFALRMEPVLLTRADSPHVSTATDGWGVMRVQEVTVEPAILRPNQEATITVRVRSPKVEMSRSRSGLARLFGGGRDRPNVLIRASSSSLWRKPFDLQFAGQQEADVAYTARVTISGGTGATQDLLNAYVAECPYDIAEGGLLKSTLVQVVTTPGEARAARLRLDAFRLAQAGETAPAAAKLKDLCALAKATSGDFASWGKVSRRIHDYPTAVAALKNAAELAPEKDRLQAMADYAEALLDNGMAETVLTEAVPMVDKIKNKHRPRDVPTALMAAIGSAYVAAGRFKEAQGVSDQLARWPDSAMDSKVRQFRRGLRVAQVEAEVKSAPGDAKAWANYGRTLIDLGRWEEAVDKLRTSLELDGRSPAVRRDLTYALTHISGQEATVASSLDDALAAAESQLGLGKGQQPSKDFLAWHTYGVLLYRKALQQRMAGDPAAGATLDRSRAMLAEGLKCGRRGADVRETYGEFSSRFINVSGFAYPEADSDFAILAGLRTLAKDPQSYLAWFNIAYEFTELRQPDLAAHALGECLKLKPDFVEARYVGALIALHRGDRQAGLSGLREVVAANPRHPYANLKLADLYAQEGDMAAAAACLAAHADVYGETHEKSQ